jgi:hypothetical protein
MSGPCPTFNPMNKVPLLSVVLLIYTGLHAQLPVSREPHHKIIQENHYYRLLEGKVRMNDTTPAHLHAANSVVIFLSHSTFGIQIVGDKPVISTVNPGDLRYVAYGDKPVNHLVWNQTPPLFHFYVVELAKHSNIKDSCPVLSQPGITLRFHQPQVTAYSLDMTQDRPSHLVAASCARLLVAITGTITAGGTALTPNQYRFFLPNTPIDLKGSGRIILLEMN